MRQEVTDQVLEFDEIKRFLPHREPFILVDRIINIDYKEGRIGTRVTGTKCLSGNEPYFAGHFPHMAIVPGVLLIESMIQTAGFAFYPEVMKRPEEFASTYHFILASIRSAKFRRPVRPGDVLRTEATLLKAKGSTFCFGCTGVIRAGNACEAEILANLMRKENKIK